MGKTPVMINGLAQAPRGKMARALLQEILSSSDFEPYPGALTGPEVNESAFEYNGGKIVLYTPEKRDQILSLHGKPKGLLAIDFTHPTAVISNGQFYCQSEIPFLMGTTGKAEDQTALEKMVSQSNISAVRRPNFAEPIVAFQRVMAEFADTHPLALSGYQLTIWESHQKSKADTSGTAKAMVEQADGSPGIFNKLGIPYKKQDIKMIRDPQEQRLLKVPEEFLDWHGWHNYTLSHPDNISTAGFSRLADLLSAFVRTSEVFSGYKQDFLSGRVTETNRESLRTGVTFKLRYDSDGNLSLDHYVNGGGVYAAGAMNDLTKLRASKEKGIFLK